MPDKIYYNDSAKQIISEETASIVMCLEFLINECNRTKLNQVADVLIETRDKITKNFWWEEKFQSNFSDFMNAFKCVIDFILLENEEARLYCLEKINEIDKKNLKSMQEEYSFS